MANSQVEESINEVIKGIDQSPEFGRRFRQLLLNSLEGSYTEDELRAVMELIDVKLEGGNEVAS